MIIKKGSKRIGLALFDFYGLRWAVWKSECAKFAMAKKIKNKLTAYQVLSLKSTEEVVINPNYKG